MNALPQPQDCCNPCETPATVSVPGPQGERGTQWTSGSGAPDDSVGENGDFYFRTSTGGVYKRVSGSYVLLFVTAGTDGHSITVYEQAGEPIPADHGDIWIVP